MPPPTPASEAVREPAPAKLNLDLLVTGRRADGRHELDSLVVFVEPGDAVEVRPGAGLTLEVAGPFAGGLAAEADNLVLRAARALAAAVGRPPDIHIRLDKALPVAAGLGGGSADAAATLRALLRLWRPALADGALEALALHLGADLPACLAGRPLRMRGIGERLEPLAPLPDLPLLLAHPGPPLATAEVFEAFAGRHGAPRAEPPATADLAAYAHALALTRNDLEPAAIRLCPPIAAVLTALRDLPGCLLARMSGSGACCFGLFADHAAASLAARALAARRPAWWVRHARPAPAVPRLDLLRMGP